MLFSFPSALLTMEIKSVITSDVNPKQINKNILIIQFFEFYKKKMYSSYLYIM